MIRGSTIREAVVERKSMLVLKAKTWAGFTPLATDEEIRAFYRMHYLWSGEIEIKRGKSSVLARPKGHE